MQNPISQRNLESLKQDLMVMLLENKGCNRISSGEIIMGNECGFEINSENSKASITYCETPFTYSQFHKSKLYVFDNRYVSENSHPCGFIPTRQQPFFNHEK